MSLGSLTMIFCLSFCLHGPKVELDHFRKSFGHSFGDFPEGKNVVTSISPTILMREGLLI